MARKIALTPASVDALQKGLLADLFTPGLTIEVLGSRSLAAKGNGACLK